MNSIRFDLPKDRSSIIKVLGVGGGGGNAVNHMFEQGIKGVDFVICNTDMQALDNSPIPNKVQLGTGLTAGLGAGANPEVGKKAAMEAIEDIIDILGVNTKMIFITAGMGGGTGTGAAPIIAKAARELDVLTVGIVTTPFSFEGKKRKLHADDGIENLKRSVDCLLVINNDKIKDMYGNLPVRQAFSHANDILTTAAKGIAEIITHPGYINVDFEDVKTVMQSSGVALMGSGAAEGENRAMEAVKAALASPLLNDNQISGAKNILLNIASGAEEVLMDEVDAISQYVQDQAGQTADVIFGTSFDEALGNKLSVTLIATGFRTADENKIVYHEPVVKNRQMLYEEVKATENNTATAKQEEPANNAAEEITFEVKQVNDEDLFPPATLEAQPSEDDEIRSRVHDAIAKEEPAMQNELISHEQEEVSMSTEEQELMIEKQIQRLKELKNLNLAINSPTGIRDLEKEPAYKRRNTKLSDVPHSSESQVSRLTLFEDPNTQKTNIRTNNSFLHDNVD
jgi:cell division protein FtsZ